MYFYPLLIPCCLLLFAVSGCVEQPQTKTARKIVVLAGAKSHGPGLHEYIKSARLLKVMLDQAPGLEPLHTEVHYDGWPEDPATLDDADLIVTISDGQDGHLGAPVPFMLPDRLPILERQMQRGCGFAVVHFSTFAPDRLAPRILEWGGGYFDWQDETEARNWYSAIQTMDTEVEVASPGHPIARGLPAAFSLKDEFYYNMRFREDDPRLVPLINVPALAGEQPRGGLVAWAVERDDGGRSFATTMGHFYSNWQDPNFRTLLLNALVWAAGAEVPREGVAAPFFTDRDVTATLYGGASRKALILTGNDHPAHDWRAKTAVLQAALEQDPRLHADVAIDIEALQYYTLADYDVLVMNYCNWEDPRGLSEAGRRAFTRYLSDGGGLLLLHFANGAFHYSLPEAPASDWPEYRRICRRVWNHDGDSGHDPFGPFTVMPTSARHVITEDLGAFETTDELYFNQQGTLPITPLLQARSGITGREEPLAWAYQYEEGRVFQTVLGHAPASLRTPEMQQVLVRAVLWAAGVLQDATDEEARTP